MIDTVRGKINIKWLPKTKTQEIPNWTFQEKIITDADGLTRTSFQASHENGMYISGDEQSAFIVQVSLPRLHFTDNTNLIEKFWQKTKQLDGIRNENILDVIPELGALK